MTNRDGSIRNLAGVVLVEALHLLGSGFEP